MREKPRIAIVGAGNLGSALAVALRQAGYEIEAIVTRARPSARARSIAKSVGAPVVRSLKGVRADVVWFCVPDAEIARAARLLAEGFLWKRRVALHSSGALTSDELVVLRERGAAVASVHPMMTFVQRSRPRLAGVSFAMEGEARAMRVARGIVKSLGGMAWVIGKREKVAYHAWGTFASPLLTALLATTERVAGIAGVSRKSAKQRMLPILAQTLANYSALDAREGFSGPIVRGDVDTVKQHLRVLEAVPAAREVYVALARAALLYLPTQRTSALGDLLRSAGKS